MNVVHRCYLPDHLQKLLTLSFLSLSPVSPLLPLPTSFNARLLKTQLPKDHDNIQIRYLLQFREIDLDMPIIQKVKDILHGHSNTSGATDTNESAPNATQTASAFDHTKVTVIYVLGGPGVGVYNYQTIKPTSFPTLSAPFPR